MKLIVGLGNPGEKYALNRHNIGFMAADAIAGHYRFQPWKKRFQGLAAEGQIGTEKCLLLKPGTYMNESGRSVGEGLRFFKLAPSDVIVIHDELDLQPGVIRVKTGGGNAGHLGLKSISAYIGNDYARVRLGIGHPGDRALVADYVLHDFAKADRAWLEPLLESVARGMTRLAEGSGAAFLSEAGRARAPAPAIRAGVQVEAAGAFGRPDPALELIMAAASKPIRAMNAPQAVPRAREGSAAAFASARGPIVAAPADPEGPAATEEARNGARLPPGTRTPAAEAEPPPMHASPSGETKEWLFGAPMAHRMWRVPGAAQENNPAADSTSPEAGRVSAEAGDTPAPEPRPETATAEANIAPSPAAPAIEPVKRRGFRAWWSGRVRGTS